MTSWNQTRRSRKATRGWEPTPGCHLCPNTFPPRFAAGSWFSPLFIALMALGLQWPQEAATFPAMPLSNLFANAVLRAQHLHLLAAETYKEFVSVVAPGQLVRVSLRVSGPHHGFLQISCERRLCNSWCLLHQLLLGINRMGPGLCLQLTAL